MWSQRPDAATTKHRSEKSEGAVKKVRRVILRGSKESEKQREGLETASSNATWESLVFDKHCCKPFLIWAKGAVAAAAPLMSLKEGIKLQ